MDLTSARPPCTAAYRSPGFLVPVTLFFLPGFRLEPEQNRAWTNVVTSVFSSSRMCDVLCRRTCDCRVPRSPRRADQHGFTSAVNYRQRVS